MLRLGFEAISIICFSWNLLLGNPQSRHSAKFVSDEQLCRNATLLDHFTKFSSFWKTFEKLIKTIKY